MTNLSIKRVGYVDGDAQRLIAPLLTEIGERYQGEGDETPFEPEEFDAPGGALLVAYLDGEPVGCAGWRTHDETGGVAELKRMYTAPAARGRGVARRVLAAVEESARTAGRRRIILECGLRQPEALALYKSAGYRPTPHFGFYRDSPEVVSLGRDL